MAKIKVYVKNNQSEVKVPVGIRLLIRRCCQAVLITEKYGKDAEVSVSFVSNSEIRKLNKVYRNKDSVTDVLSFPLTGSDGTVEINQVSSIRESCAKKKNLYSKNLEFREM